MCANVHLTAQYPSQQVTFLVCAHHTVHMLQWTMENKEQCENLGFVPVAKGDQNSLNREDTFRKIFKKEGLMRLLTANVTVNNQRWSSEELVHLKLILLLRKTMTETEISQRRKSLNRFKWKENNEVIRERGGERKRTAVVRVSNTHTRNLSFSSWFTLIETDFLIIYPSAWPFTLSFQLSRDWLQTEYLTLTATHPQPYLQSSYQKPAQSSMHH